MENNPFWGTEDNWEANGYKIIIFTGEKAGHLRLVKWFEKGSLRIEIAALGSGGLDRGLSTGGEGDVFLR